MARKVAPELAGPAPPPLARSRAKLPYKDSELEAYFALARAQPTEARRQRLTGLLCLGLGAGIQAEDLRYVKGQQELLVGGQGFSISADSSSPNGRTGLLHFRRLMRASSVA